MPTVQLHDGKVLLSDSAVLTGDECCCGPDSGCCFSPFFSDPLVVGGDGACHTAIIANGCSPDCPLSRAFCYFGDIVPCDSLFGIANYSFTGCELFAGPGCVPSGEIDVHRTCDKINFSGAITYSGPMILNCTQFNITDPPFGSGAHTQIQILSNPCTP